MDRLQHTWDALLSRFGRFTDIQSKAIDPLLAGRNCILVSATASGKTEAALAPILERQLKTQIRLSQSAIRNLFIVPTRALTRDLARRLDQPLTKLALSLAIKTGDEPALKQNRLPDVLLTTPESFDSLLANHPRVLKDVRAVVLDELHLYEDTARGDQLCILLNRLRRLRRFAYKQGDTKNASIQFCALSATIDDPALVAARYFEEPCVIESKGQREIDSELLSFDGAASLRDLFFRFSSLGIKKVLAFCQSRAECEEFAYSFCQGTPFGERVYAHHANLAARARHTVEEKFATFDAALCFATSTLELGIDIGDVDLIVLIGPPDNTASFLQRIGRGNRRTHRTRVVCFYHNEREHALFRVFLKQARRGRNLQNSNAPFRPSVVVQQLFSYIKQTRTNEIEPNAAYEIFATPQGKPLISKEHYDQIIEQLIAKNYFAASFGTLLKPSQKWEELYERREIYTNIGNDNEAIEIVDELTGRLLGFLENKMPKDSTFLFGGQTRRAKHLRGRKLFVSTGDEQIKSKPRWSSASRPLSPDLVRELALELGVPIEEKYLPLIFLEGRQPTDEIEPEAETNEIKRAVLLHSAGYAYGLVLGDLLEKTGVCVVEECDEFSLRLNIIKPITQLNFTENEITACVERRWRQFENWFTTGRWQRLLPSSVRAASTVAAFRVEKFNRTFAQVGLLQSR
jgi:ATP-dependent Lhr-like helicase